MLNPAPYLLHSPPMPCLYAPWPGRLTQMYVLIVQLYFRDTGADLARKAAIEWFRGQAPRATRRAIGPWCGSGFFFWAHILDPQH